MPQPLVFSVNDRFGKHRHNSSAGRKRDSAKRTMGVELTSLRSKDLGIGRKNFGARTYPLAMAAPVDATGLRFKDDRGGLEHLAMTKNKIGCRTLAFLLHGGGQIDRGRARAPFSDALRIVGDDFNRNARVISPPERNGTPAMDDGVG